MAIVTTKIGPISAYAIAKEEGYTGTKQQFAQEIGNASVNAQAAAASASAAEGYATSAATSASTAMSTTPTGYNSMMASIAPEYDPTDGVYAAGDYCRYNAEIYRCVTAINAPEAFDSTKWTKVTIGGQISQLSDDINDVRSSLFNDNNFNTKSKTFEFTTGTTHTSLMDQLAVSVLAGWDFTFGFHSSVSITGVQLFAYYADGSNEKIKDFSAKDYTYDFTASKDIVKLGVRIADSQPSSSVEFNVSYNGGISKSILDNETKIASLESAISAENRFENRIAFNASGTFSNAKMSVNVSNSVITIVDDAFGTSVNLELSNPINQISDMSSATKFVALKANHKYKLRIIPVSGSYDGNDDYIIIGISSGGSTADYSVPATGGEVVFSYGVDTTVSPVVYIRYDTTANVAFQYEILDVTELVTKQEVNQLQAKDTYLQEAITSNNRMENRIAFDASGTFSNAKMSVAVSNSVITLNDNAFGSSVYLELTNPISQISGLTSATKFLTLKANHRYKLRTVFVSGSLTGNDDYVRVAVTDGSSSWDHYVTPMDDEIVFSYDTDTAVSLLVYVRYDTTASIAFQYELSDVTNIVTQQEVDEIKATLYPQVPSYYATQLATVKANVTNDLRTVGRTGDNFIFITDIHWSGNWKHSPELVRSLAEDKLINLVINGGDLIDGSTDATLQFQIMGDCISSFNRAGIPMITAVGNHDYNSGYGTSDNYFSTNQYFATAQHPNAPDRMVYGGDVYFYYDKPATNTRYIVLDSGVNNIDGGINITADQITWITGLIGSTPADMHIIVIVHALGAYQSTSNPVGDGNSFVFTSGATSLCNALDGLLSSHKIEAVFFGHTHYDANFVTSGGIPLVSSNSDSKWQYYGMTQPSDGTVDAQCFDVVTIDYTEKKIYMRRVGRGSDRVISYGS